MKLGLLGNARFGSEIARRAPCGARDGMHTQSNRRTKPKLPKELAEYWDRRLFERRERDYT